jgi:hypothetical protein
MENVFDGINPNANCGLHVQILIDREIEPKPPKAVVNSLRKSFLGLLEFESSILDPRA